MRELSQMQEEVASWAAHNFPGAKRWEPLVGMQEELGELSHAFLKLHQGIRGGEDHEAAMRDALGDLIVYACHFAELNNIDLGDEVTKTWAQVKERDWQKNKESGQ